MKRLVFSLVIATLIAVGIGGWWLKSSLQKLAEPMPVQSAETFSIESGASAGSVAAALQAAGWIDSARFWLAYARWNSLDTGLKAGEYVVEPGDSSLDLMERFVAGETVLYSLTLIEGWTFAQAIAHIQAQPTIESTIAVDDQVGWLAALDTKFTHPEGLLFPSTYRYPRGTTDVTIAREAHSELTERLARAWDQRAEELPLADAYEALILASIVEKETGRDDEREQVAGVFTRRLNIGMRLQTDPTVIYGIGDAYDGDIRRRDLTTDTPYNTYTRAGLPPSPIALVGQRSIDAATNPADGTALFFVASGLGDGGHVFSDSLEEHEAAVQLYLRRQRENR